MADTQTLEQEQTTDQLPQDPNQDGGGGGGKLTPQQFAQKIKAKYPEYQNISDIDLANKIIAKHPEYKDVVDFSEKKNPVGSQNGSTSTASNTQTGTSEEPKINYADFSNTDFGNQYKNNGDIQTLVNKPVQKTGSGNLIQASADAFKANQEYKNNVVKPAIKNTAVDRLKAQGKTATDANVNSEIQDVTKDYENGDLTLNKKTGSLEKPAGFWDSFANNVGNFTNNMRYFPALAYGKATGNNELLSALGEQMSADKEYSKNHPYKALSDFINPNIMNSAINANKSKLTDTNEDKLNYSNNWAAGGEVVGNLATTLLPALIPGAKGATALADDATLSIGENIAKNYPKMLAAGGSTYATNTAETFVNLYQQNKQDFINQGLNEKDAALKSAQKSSTDAAVEGILPALGQAAFFSGAFHSPSAKSFGDALYNTLGNSAKFSVIMGAQTAGEDLIKNWQGYKTNAWDDVTNSMQMGALQTAALELLPHALSLPSKLQNELYNYASKNIAKPTLGNLLQNIPDGAKISDNITSFQEVLNKIPDDLPENKKSEIAPLIKQKEALMQSQKVIKSEWNNKDEVFKNNSDLKKDYDNKIEEHESQINDINDQINDIVKRKEAIKTESSNEDKGVVVTPPDNQPEPIAIIPKSEDISSQKTTKNEGEEKTNAEEVKPTSATDTKGATINLEAPSIEIQTQDNDTNSEAYTKNKQGEQQTGEAKPPEPPTTETVPAATEEGENKLSSIKNAVTDKKIKEAGLQPTKDAARKEFGTTWDEAQEKIKNGYDTHTLIDELKDKPRPTTDVENALLLHHQIEKESQLDAIDKNINKAFDDNDQAALEEGRIQRSKVLDDLQDTYNVNKAIGTESGRGLASRKIMADRKYTLANMMQERRAANEGKPLTPEQEAETKKQYEDIKKANDYLQQRIIDLEEENKKLQAENEVKKAKSEKSKSKKNHEDYAKERTEILKNIKDKWKGAGKGELHSDIPYRQQLAAIAPDVLKLMRNLVEEGADKLSDVVDKLHENLKDAIDGINKKDIRDIIAGQYNEPKELSEIQKKINQLKTQAKLADKLEKLQQGIEIDKKTNRPISTQEIDDLRKQIKELQDKDKEANKSFKVTFSKDKPIKKTYLDKYKASLNKRIAELERKTNQGDFSTKVKKSIVLDKEAIKLKADYERAKDKFDTALKQHQQLKRNLLQKGLDAFVKIERAFKLSGISTLAKLTSAAGTRLATEGIEEGIGGGISKLIPKIANKATLEGGVNAKALAKGYKEAFTQGMKDSWDIIKKGDGKSDIEAVFGKKGQLPPEMIGWLGQLHSALKAPVKRFAFEKSLEKRLYNNIKKGVDVSDPLVQGKIATQAYKDANRAIFMQDNFISDSYQSFVRSLESSKKYPNLGKIVSSAMQWLVPFVKVPTNIVGEVGTYSAGIPIGVGKILHTVFTKGLNNLKEDEADFVLRNLKKGSIGAGALALGYMNPQMFGGYYQEGQKRDDNDVKAGYAKIFGINIPSFFIENPLFQTFQVGATLRRLKDGITDGKPQGIGEATWATMMSVAKEEPLADQPARLYNALTKPKERDYYFDELAKSSIDPALLQNIAQWTDSDVKRKPETLGQHIEMGLPFLRENVPQKNTGGFGGGGGASGAWQNKPQPFKVYDEDNETVRQSTQKEIDDFEKLRQQKFDEKTKDYKKSDIAINKYGEVIGFDDDLSEQSRQEVSDTKKFDDLSKEQQKDLLSKVKMQSSKEAKKELFGEKTGEEQTQ